MITLVVGFVLGVLAIIVAEALGFLLLVKYLSNKEKKNSCVSQVPPTDLDPQQSLHFSYNKQGVLWVLEPEKVPKVGSEDKVSKGQKRKKEILEVFPVKKYAKIKDHSLIMTDADGSNATIHLLGCTIVSVSASDLSSRKWAKRYPIKVESRNSVIYNGSSTCYIYLETSWEKESWCKALRLASCVDKERVNWYARLSQEFRDYLKSLTAGYPSFMKPSVEISCEPIDKTSKLDASSSKFRLIMKSLAKKASKVGLENKGNGGSSSVCEERKKSEKSRSVQDLSSLTESVKTSLTEKTPDNSLDEDTVPPFPLTITDSGNQSRASVISDADSEYKFGIDEGTLCWNLLISRLFFDAKKNTEMKSSIQARIQRTLSNMRTPSYIGGVTCTGLDLGTLPPYIRNMRVLPMDMNEVWAIEIDIEYSGGAILDIETKLEVCEPEFQKGIVNRSLESGSAGEATSDLLEGIEHFGNQLKLSGETMNETEKRDEGDNKLDGMKKSKSTNWKSNYGSRWKSIINSMANQVSQVPLSLKIRVASIRGTVRLHIKPAPSDQLWYAFTSMPEIDFSLESSVGDHKITSGYVVSLLGSRFKVAIRETLVLPNCESVCIPWMLAEKDDWVPRKVAPFMWIRQEAVVSDSSSQPGEKSKLKLEASKEVSSNHHMEGKNEKTKNVASVQQPTHEASSEDLVSPSQPSRSTSHSESLQDLKAPVLLRSSDEQYESNNNSRPESPQYQSSLGAEVVKDQHFLAGEEVNLKRTTTAGRRARMMDLGKKMGEKLEEKRRHIEEKGRNIVEKMRGP